MVIEQRGRVENTRQSHLALDYWNFELGRSRSKDGPPVAYGSPPFSLERCAIGHRTYRAAHNLGYVNAIICHTALWQMQLPSTVAL